MVASLLTALGPAIGPLVGQQAQTLTGAGATREAGGGLGAAQVGGGIGGGVGGLIGNIALLAGAAGRGGKRYLKDALDVYQKIQDPDFDMRDLTPAQFQIAAIMQPEVFEAQLPGAPSLVSDSPLARAQQAQAVRGLGEIAEGGLPEADRLAAEDAARVLRGTLRGGDEAAIRSLRRRGRLGAGQELLARTVGGRRASTLASQLGSDLVRQQLQRRLQALGEFGTAASALRGQDVDVEQRRADAMNRFKEFAALQRQQAEQYGAGARERAEAYNVGTAQRVGEQQAATDYATQLANLERQNQLRQMQFGNQLARAQGMAGVYGDLYRDAEAQQAAKAKQIRGLTTGIGQAAGGGIGLGLG